MQRRMLPRLDQANRGFWTGGEREELCIDRCADCGEFTHPPRLICRHCLSESVKPTPVSGWGVVDSFTVNYQKWAPDMEVPFVIARIRLSDAEGVILTSNIVNCDVDAVAIGDSVRVTFEQHDDVYIPVFELANGG
jgi:uncharacterized OB-fold protein